MPEIVMYSTQYCPYCVAAQRFLEERKNVEVKTIDLTDDPEGRRDLVERTGRRTVPQIFVGDTHIGGYDDLRAWDSRGDLDPLLVGT